MPSGMQRVYHFSISPFKAFMFFEFEYQIFEYLKLFKFLLANFMVLFHYFKRLFEDFSK